MSEPLATESTPDADAPVEAPETPADDAQEADGDPDDWRSSFDAEKAGARIKKLQSEARNLRERAKAAEEKAAGADDHQKRISSLEGENMRLKVGYELGLPMQLASRLQGSTRDELIADAQQLVELVGSPKPMATKPIEDMRSAGRPDMPPEETDLNKIGARMFAR